MNSKAIKRQLLAAIAMVLVAAIALGSSTYAWFVASGTVEAKGMSVQAMSESGLAISFDGQVWGTSADANMSAKQLYPISTRDLSNWYHSTAKAPSSYDAGDSVRTKENTTIYTDETNGTINENNSFVVMKEFTIRSTANGDNQAKGLYVSGVTVTGADKDATKTMSTALRVGVSYTDTSGKKTTYIYAPVTLNAATGNTPTTSYNVYDESGKVIGNAEFKVDTVGQNTSLLISESTAIPFEGTGVKVQIFVWFEGEDRNLYSDNFYAENLNVTVAFSSISPSTNA